MPLDTNAPRNGALNIRVYNKDLFNALPSKSSVYSPKAPLAYVAELFDGDGCIRSGTK